MKGGSDEKQKAGCPLVWPFCKGNAHVLGTPNSQAQFESRMRTLIKDTTTNWAAIVLGSLTGGTGISEQVNFF